MKVPCATNGVCIALALVLASLAAPALAWVYPEHRDIAVLGIQTLDSERKAVFDGLWREARADHGQRLCVQAADAGQGVTPECIDWSALSAIAGDHSCSSQEMQGVVLQSPWILQVADVAAQLKLDLAQLAVLPLTDQLPAEQGRISDLRRQFESEGTRARRINALRTADTRLQRADPEYVTRAGSNNAHFLLARPHPNTHPKEYATLALSLGSEISAMGVYGWYHLSAMQKASRLAGEQLPAEERQALARAMLFDEAFALHFLEDTYAAGHVAGTWGDASQRKGTHDYYNEAGLEAFVWAGSSKSMVLMGDAHMRQEDAERAAVAVRASLEQLLDTVAGRARKTNMPYTPGAPSAPDAFNVCRNDALVHRPDGQHVPKEAGDLVFEVINPTPIPGLGPGLGAMPRFRAEVGLFTGLAGSFGSRYIEDGFSDTTDGNGFISGVDLSVRAGLGLDGVLGESGDGLVYVSLGVRGDAASTNHFADTPLIEKVGTVGAAIPGRIGLSSRIRMPFYLVPGDLLLFSPLYFFSPETYENMAVVASNGGLIPWQAGLATSIGRFQFVLGREIGATFYGLDTDDTLLTTQGNSTQLIHYKSTFIDLPIFEYRPYRSFDTTQSSALVFQLYAGADIPYSESVVLSPNAPDVDLDTAYSIGLRLIFDWRHYF